MLIRTTSQFLFCKSMRTGQTKLMISLKVLNFRATQMRPCQVIIARTVSVEAGLVAVPGAELVEVQVAKTGQEVMLAAPARSRAVIADVLDPGIPIA